MSQAHFEEFADHTRLKHAILRSYLQRWAMKLTHPKARSSQVIFVDAFAGAGRDQAGREGSPLIAARARLAVQRERSASHGRLNLFLVEENTDYFVAMKTAVEAELGVGLSGVGFENADYRDVMSGIVGAIGALPSLVFLDPYGVEGLDASLLPNLLRGPKAELFALVSGIGAARHSGVLNADPTRKFERLAALRAAPLLFPEIQAQEEEKARHEAETYAQRLDVQKPSARRHLLAALGTEEALGELGASPSPQRPTVFVRLFGEALLRSGARFVVSIPMRDAAGLYKHTLLHASKSTAAVVAMKESVSEGLNREELAADMRERIRADLTVSIEPFADHVARDLAGDGLYWAASVAGSTSLKELLVARTELFPFQCNELKARFKERGYFSRKNGKEWVEFPAIP